VPETSEDQWSQWTPAVGRLLLGRSIAATAAFGPASSSETLVEYAAAAPSLELLPTEEASHPPEDARPLQRKVEQVTARGGPYILANMIRLALGKYAVTRNSQDVSDTIRTQAEVDLGRLVATLSTVNYLAWAIPAIGFLGTVRGWPAA
jgi:hypothetical protein